MNPLNAMQRGGATQPASPSKLPPPPSTSTAPTGNLLKDSGRLQQEMVAAGGSGLVLQSASLAGRQRQPKAETPQPASQQADAHQQEEPVGPEAIHLDLRGRAGQRTGASFSSVAASGGGGGGGGGVHMLGSMLRFLGSGVVTAAIGAAHTAMGGPPSASPSRARLTHPDSATTTNPMQPSSSKEAGAAAGQLSQQQQQYHSPYQQLADRQVRHRDSVVPN